MRGCPPTTTSCGHDAIPHAENGPSTARAVTCDVANAHRENHARQPWRSSARARTQVVRCEVARGWMSNTAGWCACAT
eukprot:90009-Prymnesium_polylepis.1